MSISNIHFFIFNTHFSISLIVFGILHNSNVGYAWIAIIILDIDKYLILHSIFSYVKVFNIVYISHGTAWAVLFRPNHERMSWTWKWFPSTEHMMAEISVMLLYRSHWWFQNIKLIHRVHVVTRGKNTRNLHLSPFLALLCSMCALSEDVQYRFFDIQYSFFGIHNWLWNSGYLWIEFWICMDIHNYFWISITIYGYPWIELWISIHIYQYPQIENGYP